ncbi:uncharacterized protein V6R79_007717 [Siganus canaliculatus]
MAQFKEVLDRVRQALTCSSPAEIQALLEVLVEERIISESFSKILYLQRLTEACKLGSASTASAIHQHHHQVAQISQESAFTDQNGMTSEFMSPKAGPDRVTSSPEDYPLAMVEHYLDDRLFSAPSTYHNGCIPSSANKMREELHNAEGRPEAVSDNESINEGNLDDEKEWLEQVEEAARPITVPLWQHWDRGPKMQLPSDSTMTTGCAVSEHTETDSETKYVSNMKEEIELATACRILDFYTDSFDYTEMMDLSFTQQKKERDAFKGLHISPLGRVATTGSSTEHFSTLRTASPFQACAETDTNGITDILKNDLDQCWTDGMLCSTSGFTEDTAHVISSSTPEDAHTDAQNHFFYSNSGQSCVVKNTENVPTASYSAKLCSIDGLWDDCKNKEDEEMVDSQYGAKMQEMNQEMCLFPDLGDLPDDLSEFLSEDSLGKFFDTEVLFGDPLLNGAEIPDSCSDIVYTTELPSPDSLQQIEKDEPSKGKTNRRRKRSTGPMSPQCTDENTRRSKRQRIGGRSKSQRAPAEPVVAEGAESLSETRPADMVGFATTPPRILFQPPIQIITLPDTPGYQMVRTLRPVIGFSLPSTAPPPTYIFVPAAPRLKHQVAPLSPVGGAVAPVQMSSSPPGSLSDNASKAMPPPCASPISPSTDISICKESPLPPSPTVLDIPEFVKEYIGEAKANISQTCQDMDAGLSLSSHYVEVQVSQRETFHSGKNSGKNTAKFLDKELVTMGDTDLQKSLLKRSQIFKGSNSDKPRRYIMLFGNAGMGKTTMIRKLCLDWSRDCIPQFDFVFLLDGKALTLTEPTFSLQTLLLQLSTFACPCSEPEAVYAQILAAPKRVLIIFDGFNELRDYEILLQAQERDLVASLQRDSKAQTYTVRQLYSAILQRSLLLGCTLLLSTRPRGNASQILRRTDSFLEVCGFMPTDIETYVSQYFADPALRTAALDHLKDSSYLHLLCWNPGLCRLVCLVLEQCLSSDVLPKTFTGLCHEVLRLKMERDSKNSQPQTEPQTNVSVKSEEETEVQISRRSRAQACSRTQRPRRAKKQPKEEEVLHGEVDTTEESKILSQLCSLAWEGVKTNSSMIPPERTMSPKVKAFGHRIGLLTSYHLRTKPVNSSREGRVDKDETVIGVKEESNVNTESKNAGDDHILLWANPFLQSYLAGVHLSLSRSVSDRAFNQNLPFQSGPKGRRRTQREELELTQRFVAGLLFHSTTELQGLHSYPASVFRNTMVNKQASLTKHLEDLSLNDLNPSQILEACHYVYEASFTHGEGSKDTAGTQLLSHLAENLPEVLTFHGVPLNPSDVFAVQKVLEKGGSEGRRFCLDLEDSGIQISGLRSLVALGNINTYRACIADVITLWEQLEQSGDHVFLQGAVTKFKIHPLKATQVCHVEHLAKLVNIHMCKRLSNSENQSESILAEGVPAVRELHKLELELGPEKGPLALPKLWELMPGLHNLRHLDLENCKMGDSGAEKLADALASLCFLEVLNLPENCIGDEGVKRLATTLRNLPALHCLSLYSNAISDEGAESLAAVLSHMASLTDLDVKYNKLTDVGAQSLAMSLRNCKKVKTLRMWNQCIPYGVFERLQQQDSRILWH